MVTYVVNIFYVGIKVLSKIRTIRLHVNEKAEYLKHVDPLFYLILCTIIHPINKYRNISLPWGK